jgi:integrase
MAGLDSPTRSSLVRTTMRGIRRTIGTAQRQTAPLRLATLRKVLATLPEDTVAAVRNRAVLLLGFAGGFRRSDLVSLNIEDVQLTDDGLAIQLRRSKTDHYGAGKPVAIPGGRRQETCPVTALLRWITVAGLTNGPLFRSVRRVKVKSPADGQVRVVERVLPGRLSADTVATIVQKSLRAAGIDSADYAAHSLRSGFATEAAARGADERSIMRQGRWRSVNTLRGYIRDRELFTDNAADKLGL